MTRPRQHNAIEVFTLPLGFTKLSRLSSFIQGELQPKCLLAPTRDFRSAIMDPVGLKKGHPTWELYVSAKMIFGYFNQVASKLKSGIKTTLCFICVAAESAESLLSQLLSKSFTARSGWERAAQINFWKVHCPALLCGKGLENQNTTSLANETSSSLEEDQIVPLQCLPGETKLLKNDWKWLRRQQPRTTATSENLTFSLGFATLHTALVRLAKDVKWIVCANVIPWYGNRETKQNFIVSRSPIVARSLIVVLGGDKLYSNIRVDRVIPKHFNHMTFFSVRLM